MSTPLLPVMLEVGLAALWRASNDGMSAQITHVALGDAGYRPDQSQLGLRAERARYPIADGKRLGPRQIHLTALADGPAEFWVREVAFVLSDGTVLAVWSHPDTAIAYKAANVALLLAHDIELSVVPADSVVVHSTGAGLSLAMAEEFAAMATAAIGTMVREIRAADRSSLVERRAAALEVSLDLLRSDIAASRRRIDHIQGRQLWP